MKLIFSRQCDAHSSWYNFPAVDTMNNPNNWKMLRQSKSTCSTHPVHRLFTVHGVVLPIHGCRLCPALSCASLFFLYNSRYIEYPTHAPPRCDTTAVQQYFAVFRCLPTRRSGIVVAVMLSLIGSLSLLKLPNGPQGLWPPMIVAAYRDGSSRLSLSIGTQGEALYPKGPPILPSKVVPDNPRQTIESDHVRGGKEDV